MDFNLTKDEESLLRESEKFGRKEMAPLAFEIDQTAHFPEKLWAQMGELGYCGLTIPEAYGGTGFGATGAQLVLQGAARGGADMGTCLSWGAHLTIASMPIVICGTPEQKEKYLPKMASGEWLGGMGLTEPDAGSDASGMKTRAVRDGDSYILNGTKTFITNGPNGHVFVVFAITDKTKRSAGISAFIVEKGFPGFSASSKFNKMGVRGSMTSELIFDNCVVPASNLLGAEGEGFSKVAKAALEWERAVQMGFWLGNMEYNLELSIAYAKQRVQFKKSISEFQSIRHKLADMKMDIDATELLVKRICFQLDNGIATHSEASVAKLFLSKAIMKNVSNAVQIHGGYGLMKEYAVERSFRDAKLTEIGGGSSEIQRDIIAKALLK